MLVSWRVSQGTLTFTSKPSREKPSFCLGYQGLKLSSTLNAGSKTRKERYQTSSDSFLLANNWRMIVLSMVALFHHTSSVASEIRGIFKQITISKMNQPYTWSCGFEEVGTSPILVGSVLAGVFCRRSTRTRIQSQLIT